MNKSKLIDLLEMAIKVTGNVSFSDTKRTLLDAVQDADLNSPTICALVTEVNAISELIYGNNTLPFFALKREEGTRFMLLSDFDGEVNFRPASNVISLLFCIKGIEQVFGKKPQVSQAPILEADIQNAFLDYASQFDDGAIISPLERSDLIAADLINTVIQEAVTNLSATLKDDKESKDTLTVKDVLTETSTVEAAVTNTPKAAFDWSEFDAAEQPKAEDVFATKAPAQNLDDELNGEADQVSMDSESALNSVDPFKITR